MLKKKALTRPDRQLEKMLVSLVYVVIALAISILLLCAFPKYSFLFLTLMFVLTLSVIFIAMVLISDSERALTYGGFANVILESKHTICRIDNSDFEAVIENKPASEFFKKNGVLAFLKKRLFADSSNKLNFERLEEAISALKSENTLLELVFENETRFFNVSVQPLYLKKNDIFESEFSIEKIQKETYFFWQLEDVTATQNMEKIMEHERLRLHQFIENMPLGLYVTDGEGFLEYVNNTFAEQMDMEKENLLNYKLSDFVLDKKDKILDSALIEFSELAFFKNKKQENIELFVAQNRYKEEGVIKTRGMTLKNMPNDANLKTTLHALQSEYNLIFSYNPTAVIEASEDGAVVCYNPKALELFGKNIQNSHLSDLFEKADLKRLEQIYRHYAKTENKDIINEFETILRSGKPVSMTVAPRYKDYLKKSVFDGLILFINDTTKNKLLESQFAQAQKMQAMGQFAGGIAHDFNNLLTAMIGYCDLLLQRHRIGDPSFADLTEIKRSAVRAAALVHHLLIYSKQQPSNPKFLDVVESLFELNGFLKRILGEQISLEITYAPDLGYIYIDPVNFTQVIMNLAVNAKDAMSSKGSLKISTHIETLMEKASFGDEDVLPGDYVVVNVTDTGCGIKKENLSRIFAGL